MTLQEATAETIRELRGADKAYVFSESCGLSAGHIRMIERGVRVPSLAVLEKIAHACEMSLTELVEWIEMKTARGSEPTGRLADAAIRDEKRLQFAISSIGSQGGARNTLASTQGRALLKGRSGLA